MGGRLKKRLATSRDMDQEKKPTTKDKNEQQKWQKCITQNINCF